MRTFKKVLNGKGLLAASIAVLSGHALAETAGRVSFVSGDASVTGKDGSSRALKRGEAINGGDRITTRGGRVQIRFTDGGFVSLQPNTVFGVDEYLYANRKPEETSLFFSLVQGGMRTITGAIGKVNKKSYQVRTPVATIGIRGTEYLAQVNERGLVVSVGQGFVNVANQRGDITAGARQNIRVSGQDVVPVLTEEKVELLSTRASGGENTTADEEEEKRERERRTVTIADVQNNRGDYLFLFTTPGSLPDSVPPADPAYSVISPSSGTFLAGSPSYAEFDQDGSATGTIGGLTRAFRQYQYTSSGSTFTSSYTIFESGTLKVVNSGTIGALSWGEFTDGVSGANGLFLNDPSSGMTLGADDFRAYLIGRPTSKLPASKGFATYTLQAATPVRDSLSGDVGRVDSFTMALNLDYATLDAELKLTMPTNSYTVATASSVALGGGSLMGLSSASPSSVFSMSGSDLTVTDSNGNCASGSGSCSASISGFLAGALGTQIGASYSLYNGIGGADLSGVAALGLSGIRLNAPYLPDSTANVYYDLRTTNPNFSTFLSGMSLGFDHTGAKTGTIGGLTSVQDSYYVPPTTISGTGFWAYGKVFDSGTLKVVNSGTVGALSWGEFTDGAAAINLPESPFANSPMTLASNQFVGYIVGTAAEAKPGKGFATYTLQAATPARDVNSGARGSIDSFTMKVNLDYATLDAVLKLSMPTNSYTVFTRNSVSLAGSGPISPQALGGSGPTGVFSLSGSQLGVIDSDGLCAANGSCGASIEGFFAGADGSQIGTSYQISDWNTNADIRGVAALKLAGLSPNSTLLPDSTAGIAYQVGSPDGLAQGLENGAAAFVTFDRDGSKTGTIGGLSGVSFSTSNSFSSSYGYFDSGTLQVKNSGTIGMLAWGELTNGSTTDNSIFQCYDGCPTGLTLGSNKYVPYIVGAYPLGNLGKGTATYTLQGKTPARDNYGRAGTLNSFSMKVNLDFATVEAALRLTMPTASVPADTSSGSMTLAGKIYSVSTDGPVSLLNLGTAQRFSLNASQLQVSDSAGTCAGSFGSSSCFASIDAFFAGASGDQIGATYEINDYSSSTVNISGVAALGLTGTSGTTLASGPGYSAAWSSPLGSGTDGGHTAFDASTSTTSRDALEVNFGTPTTAGAANNVTGARRWDSQLSDYVTVMDRGTATSAESGSAGALNWGRWYASGSSALATVGGSAVELGGNDSIAYVVGPMTQPGTFKTISDQYGSAQATYTFQGGTTATGSDGSVGTLGNGSNLTVQFGPVPTVSLSLQVGMNSGANYSLYNVATVSVDPSRPVFSASTTDGKLGCFTTGGAGGSGGCGASVNGFFAGQQAQQIGLGYHINDTLNSTTVNGAGAFARGEFSSSPVLAPVVPPVVGLP